MDEQTVKILHAAGYDPQAALRVPLKRVAERRDHIRSILEALPPAEVRVDSCAYRTWRDTVLPAKVTARKRPTLLPHPR